MGIALLLVPLRSSLGRIDPPPDLGFFVSSGHASHSPKLTPWSYLQRIGVSVTRYGPLIVVVPQSLAAG